MTADMSPSSARGNIATALINMEWSWLEPECILRRGDRNAPTEVVLYMIHTPLSTSDYIQESHGFVPGCDWMLAQREGLGTFHNNYMMLSTHR